MKQVDDKLTLHEAEQLCRMYIDCNLSVLEEAELRYFLTQVDYHSPIIDEVRQIMSAENYFSNKTPINAPIDNKHISRKWSVYMSMAASFAILISVGLFLWKSSSRSSDDSQSYYIAYVDGQRLSDDEARLYIEAKEKAADDLIKEMTELEARNNEIIDNFFNQ